jgi:hypothetical protein
MAMEGTNERDGKRTREKGEKAIGTKEIKKGRKG